MTHHPSCGPCPACVKVRLASWALAATAAAALACCAVSADAPDIRPDHAPADLSSPDMRPIGPEPALVLESPAPPRRLRVRVPSRQAQ
jgi:hypothetical protein